MNEKINALIIDRTDYKEYDILIHVLTKEHGVMTWIAKGANKPKSKYGSLLQPMYLVDALIDAKQGISLFKSASILNMHPSITEHIERLTVASFMIKILAINAQDDPRLMSYDDVLAYFQLFKTVDRYAIGTHFLMTLAKQMGLELYLDGCVICNDPKIMGLSITAGGFVCQRCDDQVDHLTHSIEFYRQLRCLSKATINQISLCQGAYDTQYMQIYVDLLQDTIKIPHKNWQFLQQI